MMKSRTEWLRMATVVGALCLGLAACGDDDDDGGDPTPVATVTVTVGPGTPTHTPSHPVATPTRTPIEGAAVRGVLVVDASVRAGESDALAGAPELTFAGSRFDRSLSFADWSLECDGGSVGSASGTTDEDGRFEIGDVPPGDCTLLVTKTVAGNLMSFAVPFTVGDDGAAVEAEVSWGQVRVTSVYSLEGREFRKVSVGHRSFVVVSDGRVVEIADYSRRLVDSDDDGFLEVAGCGEAVWQCPDFGDCGADRVCSCTASCPFCDDCGPPVCVVPGPYNPYSCNEDGSCAQPGDRCVCAPTAPATADCTQQVCVPSCEPVEIESIRVYGQEELVAGQQASFGASAVMSDGAHVDITGLADWESSDDEVLEIGAWGAARGLTVGNADVTAGLDGIVSEPISVGVVARPTLRAIYIQNFDCYPRPFFGPGPFPEPFPEPWLVDFAPPPCTDVIEVGTTRQYQAMGEFANGYYEDITDEVAWSATPSSVGTIEAGLFSGSGAGTATISASLGDIESDTREIQVVTERSVADISIYPESQYYLDFPVVADIEPCFDFICPGQLTVLVDDELQFRATARYDIGGWEDVTDQVDWSTDVAGVLQYDDGGSFDAVGEGQTSVRATLGEVESHPYGIRVVAEATLQGLEVYQEGANAGDRVIEAGGEAYFHAQGYYDVGFGRDATDDVDWQTSDESVARFDQPGVLLGLAAGSVAVWAELDGVRSRTLYMEVFEQTDIEFCDVENVNRGTWTDGFNRVYLESDCADYSQPDIVQIRFTVTETERPGGIFDPCLDLYAFRVDNGVETFVRTIREEGCGEPFLAAGAPEFDDAQLRYQLQAFWDLKDDGGSAVAAGTYRIKGRFYLYYDPVVTIDIQVD